MSKPALWVDFNEIRRGNHIVALRGHWAVEPGQSVVLDDHEGLRANGTIVGPASFGDGRYVVAKIDVSTYQDYEPWA